jgi:type I restriction enzyme S subunit
MKDRVDVKLENICEFISGGTPDTKVSRYFQGQIPWITGADITGNIVSKARSYITEEAIEASATNVVPKGNILLVTRTSVGKVAVTGVDICISQDFTGLLPDKTSLNEWFLFYYLVTKQPYFTENQRGATIQGIPREIVANLVIPLPPLPEQQRIAAILAKADRLRRLRRYALDLGESYLQSVFLEMFGQQLKPDHPKIPLGDLVTITGGGTPSREVDSYFIGDIPWLTSKDMIGEYISDTQEHITEEAIKNSATKLVPKNSILVVVKSKILMRRLPLAITRVPLCHGQDIKSIQCPATIEPLFLLYVLKHNESRLLDQARGANTEGLTLPMLQEVPVPHVDFSLQQKFAKIAHQYERLRAQQREAVRQAEHLFQALLQRAFAGGVSL